MESVTQAVGSFEDPEIARDLRGDVPRESPRAVATPSFGSRRTSLTWDVTDLLPAVECPTLVMHPRRSRYFPVTNAQRHGGRHSRSPPADHRNELFVHSSRRDSARLPSSSWVSETMPARPRSATSMVVVLFADIVNSTGLTEQWGDAEFRNALRTGSIGTLRAVIERARRARWSRARPSATACSPHSFPRTMPSPPPGDVRGPATTRDCRFTSGCTLATSSERRATCSAGRSTSRRGCRRSPPRARSSCLRPCASSLAHRRVSRSRTAASTSSRA